jgi:hypothetical protein
MPWCGFLGRLGRKVFGPGFLISEFYYWRPGSQWQRLSSKVQRWVQYGDSLLNSLNSGVGPLAPLNQMRLGLDRLKHAK